MLQIIEALNARGVEFVGDPVTSPGVQLREVVSDKTRSKVQRSRV